MLLLVGVGWTTTGVRIPAPLAVWRIIADHADVTAYERLTLFAVALLVITELAGWLTI